MKKHKSFCFAVLTTILTISSLGIVNQNAEARPCGHTWFARAGCAVDPTNPDRNGGRTQRLDPTNPNSPAGRIVKIAFPVAC